MGYGETHRQRELVATARHDTQSTTLSHVTQHARVRIRNSILIAFLSPWKVHHHTSQTRGKGSTTTLTV